MVDACPLCASRSWREIFRALRPAAAPSTGRHTEDLFGRAGPIVRCTQCGLVRQLNPPHAPYEDAVDDEYLAEEPGIRSTFRTLLERIDRHRAPPGRLLDIGCGPGFLLDEARTRGWTVAGVELSRWGVEQSRARGLDVYAGTLEDVDLGDQFFDVIVVADVIEHVFDPLSFLERIRSLLRPDGVVFIATPNVDSVIARVLRRWWWSVIPNHVLFFSRRSLERTVQSAGLKVSEVSTHPKTFSVEYYAGRFGGYATLLGHVAVRVSRAFGGRERLVTPDFHDRVSMIATKR